MGAYDTVYFDGDVEIDVEGIPFDLSVDEEDRCRGWQTKDLNPSMDCYALRPYGNDKVFLYRRHPPVWRWTEVNEGSMTDSDEIEVFEGAEHWRLVKVTGKIELSEAVRDGSNVFIYVLSAEFKSGELCDVELLERIESDVTPLEEIVELEDE